MKFTHKIALFTAAIGAQCSLLGAVIQNAHATPARDFYIQQAMARYFSLPQDARSLGLGGATSTICTGPQCLYMNPAGSARTSFSALAGSIGADRFSGDEFLEQSEITQRQYSGYLSGSVPIGSTEFTRANGEVSDEGAPYYGAVLLGYSRYHGDTNDSINTTPDGHRRSIGYALAPSDALSLGYAFHFYDDQLRTDLADLHSHARFLHLFGAQYELSKQTTLGLVLKYGLGQSDTEEFEIQSNGLSRPRQYTAALAVSHDIDGVRLYAGQDYTKLHSDGNLTEVASPAVVIGSDESGYTLTTKLGVELLDLHDFSLRAGVRYQWAEYTFERTDLQSLTGNYSGVGISGGVGYTLAGDVGHANSIRVDYGVEYAHIGNGSWEHILSLVLPFSL